MNEVRVQNNRINKTKVGSLKRSTKVINSDQESRN